jgi:hypothetical protein
MAEGFLGVETHVIRAPRDQTKFRLVETDAQLNADGSVQCPPVNEAVPDPEVYDRDMRAKFEEPSD